MRDLGVDYEFRNIEDLIRQAISSSANWNGSFEKKFAHVRRAVAEESEKIKKEFALCALSLGNQNLVKRFVQCHQHALISFIDELFERSVSKSRAKAKRDSGISAELFFFYSQVEDVLDFIQAHFPKYFDLNAKLPEPKKLRLSTHMQKTYTVIHDLLMNQNIDPTLLSVCLSPICKIVNDLEPNVTYQKIGYADILIHSLQKIAEGDTMNGRINDDICSMLFYLDYNGEDYFSFYVQLIKDDVSSADSIVGQLEKLAFHLKAINQSSVKAGLVYDKTVPSIKKQLVNWVLEEIQYLDKRLQLANVSTKEEDFVKTDFKIEFDISVSQLACLVKVFIEAGIIRNKNISELLRFLSKFVKTKHSEHVSTESFRIKYYDVENGTKHSVRNLFHTAISYINSN